MEADKYERVVIGGGIIGACAARQLVKAGHRRVLLLDQFPMPHSRGSSHGHSRIIRTAYRDLVQGQMARRSRAIWSDMERQTGETLVQDVPLLVVGSQSPEVCEEFNACVSCLEDPTIIKGPELSSALPVAAFPADSIGCIDNTAGILLADKCLAAAIRLFTSSGGHLRSSWPVTDIVPQGNTVLVRGRKGNIITEGLVVCAGAWSGPLVSPLGVDLKRLLTPQRIPVMYWRVKEGFKVPMSGIDIRDNEDIYWLPSKEYPGLLKLCAHFGAACDPDRRDLTSVEEVVTTVVNYVKKTFPGLHNEPEVVETCMYTITPDKRCIIDVHPLHSNIVIATGMSGEGFKMGPVFGEVIQKLIDGERAEFDLAKFSLQRFHNNDAARL